MSPEGPLARELKEIEDSVRHLQALVKTGALEADLAESVYRRLEARQDHLLKGDSGSSSTRSEPLSDTPPIWVHLEHLLGACPDVRELSLTSRKQALSWYREMAWADLPRLSSACLLALARLLRFSHLNNKARQVYELILQSPPVTPEVIEEAEQLRLTLAPAEEKTPAVVDTKISGKEIEPVLVTTSTTDMPAPVPRRSWGSMLAAFMEDRNIFWGELVGGLLIVGCSLALVVSLWRTLEEAIPHFPFLVFATLTTGLFGAGHYTLRHWKLEATSRGLLVIATLLTPLCFLVLAGLAAGRPAELLDWGLALLAVVGFMLLVCASARVLLRPVVSPETSQTDWLLALAVVLGSASQLLVPRWLDAVAPALLPFLLLSLVPPALQALAAGPVLWSLERRDPLTAPQSNALLLLLGQSMFAVLASFGFLIYWSAVPSQTVHHLAVPLALSGLPLLAGGFLIWDKLKHVSPTNEKDEDGLPTSVSRLMGTGVGIAGLVFLMTALALSWPRPPALVFLGFMNALVFLGLAHVATLPRAHVAGSLCLTVGFLTLFHWLRGTLAVEESERGARLLSEVVSPAGAVGLTLLAALFALLGETLARLGRRTDAIYPFSAAGVAALGGMLLVLPEGYTEPGRGAFVFGTCGLGVVLMNARWRKPLLTSVGAAVLLGFLVYLIRWGWPGLPDSHLWLIALLLHATSTLAAGLWLRNDRDPEGADSAFAIPLCDAALTASFLALLPLSLSVGWESLATCALCSLWLAALWFAMVWHEQPALLFTFCQGAVTLAVLFGVADWLQGQEWVGGRADRLLHLWSLQVFALSLAGFCLVGAALRHGLQKWDRVRALFEPRGWLTFDRVLLLALIAGQLLLTLLAVWPELIREIVSPSELVAFRHLTTPLQSSLSWLLLGLLIAALLPTLREERPQITLLAFPYLVVTLPLLIANAFDELRAATSALRWALALLCLLSSGLMWARSWLARSEGQNVIQQLRWLCLCLTVVPVLALTAWIAGRGFAGLVVPGPEADSIFARMGWTASMVIPLGIIVLALTGHAVRENLAGYLFAAGQLFVVTVCGGYALALVTGGSPFGTTESILIVQLGIFTASLWGLGWLWTGRWRVPALLLAQVGFAAVGGLLLLMAALVEFLVTTTLTASALLSQCSSVLGWTGWLATATATLWVIRLNAPKWVIHVLGVSGLGSGILASITALKTDPSGQLSYHLLTLAWTILAMLFLSASWAGTRVRADWLATLLQEGFPARPTRRWVEITSGAVVLLALGGAASDPGQPYWSSGAILAVSLLLGALAIWTWRPVYVYASGLLLNVAAYLIWQAILVDQWGLTGWHAGGPDVTDRFFLFQALALAIGSIGWSVIEGGLRKRDSDTNLRGEGIPYVHFAALLALHLLAILILTGLAGDFLRTKIYLFDPLLWLVLGVTTAALVLLFRDPEASRWGLPGPALYVAGLLAVALFLHQLSLVPLDLLWATGVALAAFVLAANWIIRTSPGGWCVPAQGLVGALALTISLWLSLEHPTTLGRMGGPLAATLLLLASLLHVGVSVPAILTLSFGVLVAAEFSWALLDPDSLVPWLHRNARLLAVLATFAVLYGSAPGKILPRESPWASHARRLATILSALAVGLLAVFLVQEFLLYDAVLRKTRLSVFETLLVATLLALILFGLLWVALSSRTPFGLKERGRVRCVWSAELLLVLLLTHLRLNVPDLFPSYLGRYWPFVLMTLGFLGVGLGELFRRRTIPELACPLHQTGLFLPLVPLLAYITRPIVQMSGMGEAIPGTQPLLRYLDRLPQQYGLHVLLWFLLALLYSLVAVMRRTSWYALLGALAANFGLWVFYAHHDRLAFVLHPQLWLIPLGLIMLVTEHLNRDFLSEKQATGVRSVGLLLLYLSSTADMFITGLGNSVVFPILLAVLSIFGVLAGILLRVRGFLFMGMTFLVLVLFTQIWYAAVSRAQTWVWWASGIVLGVAILSLFALFEKRRNDVIRMFEEIKRWR